MFRFDIGDKVKTASGAGTVVGVLQYQDEKDGSITREEYQIALEVSGGSGAFTHFAEGEVQRADDQR